MQTHPAIAHDAWLSEQMGRPCYMLRLAASGVSADVAAALERVLATDAFVTAKLATNDVATVIALERAGFSVIDTQVVLEASTLETPKPAAVRVREARDEDRARVEDIARRSFRFTRFHLDPRIDRSVADEIKAQWAGNFFRGKRGDALVVAEREGEVCGFNQLLFQDGGETLTIDLIAVAEEHHGVGAATAMIGFVPARCAAPKKHRVATQVANIPSLRLYEKVGFRMAQSQYVLHAHGRAS